MDTKNELIDLMLADDPAAALRAAADAGRLDDLLPEVVALRDMDTRGRHKNVYRHSLQVLTNAVALETEGPDLVLRLAALLHDIGKPATRKFRGKKVTFQNHETVGARDARRRLAALGFSRAEVVQPVAHLVRLHMRLHGFAESAWTDSAVRRLITDADPELDRLLALMRADVTSGRPEQRRKMDRMYDRFAHRVKEVQARDSAAAVRPDLTGDQVMELLDLRPGPQVGEAMRFLLRLRKEEGPLGEEVAADRLREWAAAR